VHGEEIRCVVEPRDQLQLVAKLAGDRRGHAARVAPGRACHRSALQHGLSGHVGRGNLVWRGGLVGVLVAQVVEREAGALGQLHAAGQRRGVALEQPQRFPGRAQVAVEGAFAPEAGVFDGAALADAGQHVLQDAALRHVVQHVAGGHARHPGPRRQRRQVVQADGVVGPPAQRQRQRGALAELRAQPVEPRGQLGRPRRGSGVVPLAGVTGGVPGGVGRHQHGEQPRRVPGQGVARQVPDALAAAGPVLARDRGAVRVAPGAPERDQPAQARPGRTVGGVEQQVGAVREAEPGAGHQPHPGFGRAAVGTGDTGHRVAVGDAERRVAGQRGLREQLLHPGGAAQERVVRGDLKFYVGGHGRSRIASWRAWNKQGSESRRGWALPVA